MEFGMNHVKSASYVSTTGNSASSINLLQSDICIKVLLVSLWLLEYHKFKFFYVSTFYTV